MKNQKTKNLTIGLKRKRMQEEFPDLEISNSTVWKVFIFKILNCIIFLDLEKVLSIQL